MWGRIAVGPVLWTGRIWGLVDAPGRSKRTGPTTLSLLARRLDLERRIDAHAEHGALRQLDFLPLGRRNGAAAADDEAGDRALEAAQDAANDRADTRASTDSASFAPDAFTLDRLGHGAAHRVGPAVDSDLIEADCHLGCAVGASGGLYRGDHAPHQRSGRNRRPAVDVHIHQRRRLKTILDQHRAGVQTVLQADVELRASRNFDHPGRANHAGTARRRRSRACPRPGRVRARAGQRICAAGIAARSRPYVFDAVAHVRIFHTSQSALLAQLHLQIDDLVAKIVELSLQLAGPRRI